MSERNAIERIKYFHDKFKKLKFLLAPSEEIIIYCKDPAKQTLHTLTVKPVNFPDDFIGDLIEQVFRVLKEKGYTLIAVRGLTVTSEEMLVEFNRWAEYWQQWLQQMNELMKRQPKQDTSYSYTG